MHQRSIYRILAFFGLVLVLVSAIIAIAQSPESSKVLTLNTGNSWQGAQLIGSSKGKLFRKLFVVTLEEPNLRRACRLQSFDLDKLVCSRAIGGPQIFLQQQVAALIVPGDGRLKLWLLLGLNGEMGAAIWGTVVLATACPACAVATGIAALYFSAVLEPSCLEMTSQTACSTLHPGSTCLASLAMFNPEFLGAATLDRDALVLSLRFDSDLRT